MNSLKIFPGIYERNREALKSKQREYNRRKVEQMCDDCNWVYKPKEPEVRVEYGGEGFRLPTNVTLFDSEDKPVMCHCGFPAIGGVVSRNSYRTWCRKCAPEEVKAHLVYIPPTGTNAQITDDWVVNLKPMEDSDANP